ncbi:O-antigen ligase family protein [Sporomusa carbonis]|uniref:O-antigen ligase family protein n=1 Tax=Sporomusa carbonis TaxID=3076075 RepID=UPI003C7C85FE
MNDIEKLDKMIFGSLCGYSLMSCVSLAAVNIFIALTTVLAIMRFVRKRPAIDMPKQYFKPIAIFFVTLFFLMIISPDFDASIKKFWLFVYRMIPFIAVLAFIKDKHQIYTLITLIIISVTTADIYAIWQGMHGDYRAKAFGGHPMDLAGILVQWIPMLLIMSIDNQWCAQRKYIVAALLIGCAAVLFNGTRGAWITLAIIMPTAVFMYHNETKKMMVYVLIAIMAVGILVYNVPELNARMVTLTDKSFQSNSERILMWNSAWKMFYDYPLTGVGLGTYAHRYQTEYISPKALERNLGHAHNNFLQMLAETGIVGFLSFCFMFGSFLYYTFKDWRQFHYTAALMFFSATCGIILQGLTEFTFGNRIVMTLYFFLMALYLQYIKQCSKCLTQQEI